MSQEDEAKGGEGNTDTAQAEEKDLAEQMFDGGEAEKAEKAKEAEEAKKAAEAEEGKESEDDKSEEEKKSEDEAKKAEEAKKLEDDKKSEEEKKAEAAKPENFDYSLPDGDELTEENKKTVIQLATDGKWTPEETKANLEAFHKMRTDEIATNVEAQKAILKEWTDEIANDKKIGGKKLGESLAKADELIAKVGKKAFYEDDITDAQGVEHKKGDPIKNEKGVHLTSFGIMLKETGVGSHPEFVRFMVDLGGMVTEDQIVHAATDQEQKPVADLFYPGQGKK